MTTPSNSPEHPAEEPAAQPGPPPAAEPFAPVARAPRTPWVNPARRGHIAAAAVVGALVFGGGGLLIGHAMTGDGEHRADRHGGIMRLEHGQDMHGQDIHGQGIPGQGPPRQHVPNHPPAPAPSGSPTS